LDVPPWHSRAVAPKPPNASPAPMCEQELLHQIGNRV
jgi:hypothetical protein